MSSVHILGLPVEVSFFILDRLPHEALLAFSSCSRQCRGLSLPLLFRGMALSPESIRHLQAKEDFDRLRSGVTLISINTYRPHIVDAGIDTVLDHLRITLAALNLFPHMKRLSITLTRLSAIYAQTLQFDRWLLDGIFHAISMSLGKRYRALEHLSLNIPRANDTFVNPASRIKNHISEVNQRFLGLTPDSKVEGASVPYPPALRTASINIDYDQNLHDIGLAYLKILKRSTETLESLGLDSRIHMTPGTWVSPFFPDCTWSRLRKLLLCHTFLTNRDVVDQLADRFPNVDEVEVRERFMQRDSATTSLQALRGMKTLRVVTVPWPWEGTVSVRPVPIVLLERAVSAFISHGLMRMEKVVFATSACGKFDEIVGTCMIEREAVIRWNLSWVDTPTESDLRSLRHSSD
ncbi:hypothetical protein ABW21_db0206343 [Orbilia brochopaga]|nr:hypothetical protein ABW21_db0206343 [Drechslerella brochopaga]